MPLFEPHFERKNAFLNGDSWRLKLRKISLIYMQYYFIEECVFENGFSKNEVQTRARECDQRVLKMLIQTIILVGLFVKKNLKITLLRSYF